jgi:Ran GTPase-activating protein (RanGAP) involved in mRNA processing and transport
VRNSDPCILPEPGEAFKMHPLSENQAMELADALLENTNVTYIQLVTARYKESSAVAMAAYVRTSKRLQRIDWNGEDCELPQRKEMLCCFLPAFQESTSLKKLHMGLPRVGGPYLSALEDMLTHTKSLQSLSLIYRDGLLEETVVAAARSGLEKNTTLRELTLEFSEAGTTVYPILISLSDHPLLQRLRLCGSGVDLTGLHTLLQSGTSNISELEIREFEEDPPMTGLKLVLEALQRYPKLIKLGLRYRDVSRTQAEVLRTALCKITSLQSLVLERNALGKARLAQLAPALYNNMDIKVLNLSCNDLKNVKSAKILQGILRRNKTMTALVLSENEFGLITGAVANMAKGLVINSTLLKIDLSRCVLGDSGVSILAQALGSPKMKLQKLILQSNSITSTGVGVLLEAMEQSSHITDLDLSRNLIRDEGASRLALSLRSNTLLSNLTSLSIHECGIGDDGFTTLVLALEQNTALLHLDLRDNCDFSKPAISAFADSLPEIKVLQRVDLAWCTGLASASTMSLLLAGLHGNKSLFRFHVSGCAPIWVPPALQEMATYSAGGWMQEMERLGYRNRFRPLTRAPEDRLLPRGVWPHALARVATLPDVIFDALRSKPNLVPSEDA